MNLEKLFDFIKEKRGYKPPIMYKLINGLELAEDELTVKGSLDLEFYDIIKLPDNLTVTGNLDLQGVEIAELPDNLHVGGYLDLDRALIEEIPNNLRVDGDIFLFHTPIIEKYNKEKIRKIIEEKGGYVNGVVYVSYYQ